MFQALTDHQTLLELHRAHPDDENVWEQLQDARTHLERTWLENLHAAS